ncbi:MAG: hypothetical protein ACLSA6_08650 [Holdemania massiliensis]
MRRSQDPQVVRQLGLIQQTVDVVVMGSLGSKRQCVMVQPSQ